MRDLKKITRTNVEDRSGNRYCGPLVIAALLGVSTTEAAAKVRDTDPRITAVKGMYNSTMVSTLRNNGYRVIEETVPKHLVRKPFAGTHWSYDWRRDSQDTDESAYSPLMKVGPTFAEWLRSRDECQRVSTYVVVVSNHYVLVSGRKMVDTFTKGVWTAIGKAPHRRKRVESVYRVETEYAFPVRRRD